METINAALVGVNFRGKEAKDVVANLSIGEALHLEAEPSNPYDENAVKVIHPETGMFIGYLSRESNAETSEHLQADGAYTCTVLSFLSTYKPDLAIDLIEESQEENGPDQDHDEHELDMPDTMPYKPTLGDESDGA